MDYQVMRTQIFSFSFQTRKWWQTFKNLNTKINFIWRKGKVEESTFSWRFGEAGDWWIGMINVGCRAYLELERVSNSNISERPLTISQLGCRRVCQLWAEIESGMEAGLSTGQWQLLIYGEGNQHRLEISGNRFCPNGDQFIYTFSVLLCLFNAAFRIWVSFCGTGKW